MRTSRVSRDTSRVANALSSANALGPRRSLRNFAHIAPADRESSKENHLTGDEQDAPADQTRVLGKRKREAAAAKIDAVETKTPASVRQSPRKAPATAPGGPSRPRAKRQPAKHIKGEDGTVTVEAPANWEQLYNITAEMRKTVLAPVDTMGCESLAEPDRSPVDRRLQTLVALMLSSQTKDTVTAVAMKNLQTGLPGGFNLDALLQVEPEQLNKMIEKVGFHNNKTKFIKSVAVILRDQFNSDIPDTIEGLVSLPGVGPKMAYLTMSAAWGRDEGIGVDVHVHRITNLWGWHKTANPEQTRAALESWLPKDKWHDINHLLVGFGQTICLPVGRNCGDCRLSELRLCPSAVASSPKKKRVKKEVELGVDERQDAVKAEVKIESDDVATVAEIKTEEQGQVITQQLHSGAHPDIEGFGAGSERKLRRAIKTEPE